LTETCTKHWA